MKPSTAPERMLRLFLMLVLCVLVLAGQGDHVGLNVAGFIPDIPGGAWTSIFLALLIALASGLFTAAETAIGGLRPNALRSYREKDAAKADRVLALLDKQEAAVASCTLGLNLMRLFLVLPVLLIAPGVANYLSHWIAWDPQNYLVIVGCAFGLLLIPFGPLTVGVEQGFRVYASVHPISASDRLRPLAYAAMILFAVPARITNAFSQLVSRRLHEVAPPAATLAEDEIKTLVESAEETGEIEEQEGELIHSAFEFGDTIAREVMTPRVDLDALSVDSDPREITRVISETGHSRIPIYEGTDDQIIGIVHAKDLLMALLENPEPDVRALLRPVLFVPENRRLHELLADMRQARSELAVVQDEFGGTSGIVTTEDIVEELVGEIMDEYDVEEPEIVPVGEGWSVDGKVHLDDLNDEIGTDFESEEFDTVGGFVFGHFGRQPSPEEAITIDGYVFSVETTDGRRILRVRLERELAV